MIVSRKGEGDMCEENGSVSRSAEGSMEGCGGGLRRLRCFISMMPLSLPLVTVVS